MQVTTDVLYSSSFEVCNGRDLLQYSLKYGDSPSQNRAVNPIYARMSVNQKKKGGGATEINAANEFIVDVVLISAKNKLSFDKIFGKPSC